MKDARRRTTNGLKGLHKAIEGGKEGQKINSIPSTWARFETALIAKNRSLNTIQAYKKTLLKFGRYVAMEKFDKEDWKTLKLDDMGFISIYDIDEEIVTNFFYWVKFTEKLTDVSIANLAKNLRVWMKFTCKAYKLEDISDSIITPKLETKVKWIPTDKDINQYLEQLDTSIFTEFRLYVVISILRYTGVRITELESIRLEDIDWDKKTILINGKGRRQRMIGINSKLFPILKTYVNEIASFADSEYLLVTEKGGKLSKRSLSHSIHEHGVNIGSNIQSSHCLRRYAIKEMVDNGIPILTISKVVGSSVDVILSHYYDTNDKDIQKAFNTINRRK